MSIAARCVDGLGVCVIPQPKNDHKPLALRHGPLSVISAILITAKIIALGAIAFTPNTAELSTITSGRIVQLTNAERKSAGLKELTVNSKLTEAATMKANDMLAKDYFAHISPSGVTPWFWMSKVNYSYIVAGENLAIDFTEAEAVVDAWMASPSHKANIVHSEYTETGVAVVAGEFQGGTSIVVVHMFGKPQGTVAAQQTTKVSTPTPSPTPATSTKPTPTIQPTTAPTQIPSTPTPVPAIPPRIPRIALVNSTDQVQDMVKLAIEGTAGDKVTILINNQQRSTVVVGQDGTIETTLNISSIPDGDLTLRAYSTNADNEESPVTVALLITKDTSAPTLAVSDFAFLVSPITDSPAIAVKSLSASVKNIANINQSNILITPSADNWTALPSTTQTLSFSATDAAGNAANVDAYAIAPIFSENPEDVIEIPAKISKFTRQLSATVLIVIFILLTMAVMIRIRIQHPALITHASLVVGLAAIFLLF